MVTRSRHNYYCRTSEDYRRFHAPALLKQLSEIRQEICRQRAPLNSPDKDALRKITEAIDDFAGLVTGDREHFWLKPHRVRERRPVTSEGAPRPDAPPRSKPDDETWG